MNLRKTAVLLLVCVCACFRASAQSTTNTDAVTITVHVGGMVKNFGDYKLSKNATITDAIEAAGGLNGTDGGYQGHIPLNKIRVMRGGKAIIVDVRKIMRHETEDFFLQDGDNVQVPEIVS